MPVYTGGMIEDVKVTGGAAGKDTHVRLSDQELLLQKGSPVLFYMQDGIKTEHIYQGALAEDTAFSVQEKDLCFEVRSVVLFYKDGSLKSGQLVRDTGLLFTGKNIAMPAGSFLEIDEQGELIRFNGPAIPTRQNPDLQ